MKKTKSILVSVLFTFAIGSFVFANFGIGTSAYAAEDCEECCNWGGWEATSGNCTERTVNSCYRFRYPNMENTCDEPCSSSYTVSCLWIDPGTGVNKTNCRKYKCAAQPSS